MSNTSIGPALKGSKKQMQNIASAKNHHYLNGLLGDTLKWISPCEPDYREFQLNNPELCKRLGIPKGVFKDFWPSRQPQWDGIAMGEKTKTLYLFEAKSHITEIKPRLTEGTEENNRMIEHSIMRMASDWFNITDSDEDVKNIWCQKYYQISNRMAFCKKMQELSKVSNYYKKVVLVFLNFVNDESWSKEGKTVKTKEEWDNYYDETILESMKITRSQLEKQGIFIINFDLKK